MESTTDILVMLLAVVASSVLTRVFPLSIPRPLVQIMLGAIVGRFESLNMVLDPQLFFLLFLPPLLFLDGWRISKEELSRDRNTILALALGLVVFTVLGIGVFIHWMIPAIPLSVAFALAAIVSPTDPIAVSAIAQQVSVPKRLMHILEAESLLNDASGLVCFRFAIAATMTGAFSVVDAATSFIWIAAGGIAIGSGFTLAMTWMQQRLSRRFGEESGQQILVSVLIPFGCYLIAERFHCSGILAAVSAGLTMSFVEARGEGLAVTRIRRNSVWDMIQFTANGVIFVLLGEQLPAILSVDPSTLLLDVGRSKWWIALYVIAITLGLASLRFAWGYVSLRLTLMGNGDHGIASENSHWRLIAPMSVAGVRGAVTLAGVLTMPVALTNGVPFPARDLAILLAMGVIVLSLIGASVALPPLLRGLVMPQEPAQDAEEERARTAADGAAIAEIERLQLRYSDGKQDVDIYVTAAARVMDFYRTRLERRSEDAETLVAAKEGAVAEREFRIAGLRAERAEIFRRLGARELSSEIARKLVGELDLMEVHEGLKTPASH